MSGEFILGALAMLYILGIIAGLVIFCLHIGTQSSSLPFPIRFIGALIAAILWPISFALYGAFNRWTERRIGRENAIAEARWEAEEITVDRSDPELYPNG